MEETRDRRHTIAELRSQGLTFQEIGDRLGITRQCAAELLRRGGKPVRVPGIPCCECGAEIAPRRDAALHNGPALCLTCLAKHPEATLGQRLKAHRLTAGLTLCQLAERTGIGAGNLGNIEQGRTEPRWTSVALLIRVLDVALVDVNNEVAGGPRRAGKRPEGPRDRRKGR